MPEPTVDQLELELATLRHRLYLAEAVALAATDLVNGQVRLMPYNLERLSTALRSWKRTFDEAAVAHARPHTGD
jgi:hypothetical protein